MTDRVPEAPGLHPDIAALGLLVGTWAGEGSGEYPTTKPFGYGEELRFDHIGKPFLRYAQRTWSTDDGRPLHSESGYVRFHPPSSVELVVAHPIGIVEVDEGEIEDGKVVLHSKVIGRTSSAKEVAAITRHIEVDGATLRYQLDMAAVGQPLVQHLEATLHRVSREA